MLQQTQVPRVLLKYQEFLARFPSLAALAAAERAEVVRAWESLGYNRRAVHLHRLAQQVQHVRGGVFPRTSAELRTLPGIGPYTAAAIACFAFDEQTAAIDTNARRVLGRLFLGHTDAPPGERAARALAAQVLPEGQAYAWNQAIMDLGATICTARRPACRRCPVAVACAARPLLERPALPGAGALPQPAPKTGGKIPERYEGSRRFYRGRIVQALRLLPPGEGIAPEGLGPRLRASFTSVDLPWLERLLLDLERDGLIVIERGRHVAEGGGALLYQAVDPSGARAGQAPAGMHRWRVRLA
jgi:A/G-specific adenine glycosylase